MWSFTKARQRLLAALPVCQAETIPLSNGGQRVLAEAIKATLDSPRFDNSSMDGFALRAADVEAASPAGPVRLKVIGDLPAGTAFDGSVKSGQAMRIMTGAAMPRGADAVVPVEDTDAAVAQAGAAVPGAVEVRRSLKVGDYVRPVGEDFRAGDVVMDEGSRLRAQDLALLAMLGRGELLAYCKPRVAILSSGNELLTVGKALSAGKIYETNSYAL